MKTGDYQKEIECFKEAIWLRPDDAIARYNLGVAYGETGDYQKAIECFKEAIRLKPDLAEAHCGLGVAYQGLGESKKAIESYKKSIQITPDNASPHFNLGLSYIKSEEWENAIESFKQVIRIKLDYAEAHCSLGLAYTKSGDYQKAIESFKQVIRIKPDYADAHYGLGGTYIKSGDYQKAIESHKEAIRIKPDYAAAHFQLGCGYLIIGDRGNALGEYKILKDLDKELANKLFNLINEPINKNTISTKTTEPSLDSSCAYLDIETTGFSPSSGDITVIGIYLEKGEEKEFISLVDNDISSTRLGEIFKDVDLLYTYNGAAFDLRFIQAKLGLDLTRYCKHMDLMKECHERGIYGGLKETERKLGINRKWDIHGREAVALWYKYKYEGNKEALNTLLNYNKEDVVNLSQLKRKLATLRPNAETQRKPHVEYPPLNEDEIYKSHLGTGTPGDWGLKDTRIASSPQTALQQNNKPQKWYDNVWNIGYLVAWLWVLLIIILMALGII